MLKHGASTKEEVGYESSRGRDIRFLQSPEGTHRVGHNQVQLLGLAVSAGRLQDVRELLEAGNFHPLAKSALSAVHAWDMGQQSPRRTKVPHIRDQRGCSDQKSRIFRTFCPE